MKVIRSAGGTSGTSKQINRRKEFKKLEHAVHTLRSRMLFNGVDAYNKPAIFNASKLQRGKLVKAEPSLIHYVANGKNSLLLNMGAIEFDKTNEITDLNKELSESVTVLNDKDCFKNMTFMRRMASFKFDGLEPARDKKEGVFVLANKYLDKHFTFTFDPQTGLFAFSQREMDNNVLANGLKILFQRGYLKKENSPIMIKGMIGTDDRANITSFVAGMFTSYEIENIGEPMIMWTYARMAEGFKSLGASPFMHIHDMVTNVKEAKCFLKKHECTTLGKLSSSFRIQPPKEK